MLTARTLTITLLFLMLAPASMRAAPVTYLLDPANSTVAFETDFGPDKITGKMPVEEAALSLDFDAVSKSKIDVRLGAAEANASFPFAAQAMKGPKVLDTGNHPDIHFVSTAVKATRDGAAVQGDLTIRGVTRPVTMQAVIWRQQGTEAGDRSRLTLRLTARVNRSDYGASGWSDLVGDEVRITIMARVSQKG